MQYMCLNNLDTKVGSSVWDPPFFIVCNTSADGGIPNKYHFDKLVVIIAYLDPYLP